MTLCRKVCTDPGLKFYGDGNGEIAGYASVFGNVDRGNEIVAKGAFSGSLADFLANGFYASGHNWDAHPIGFFTDAREDDHGLHFTAQFHSTPEAQAARTVALERMAAGKSVSTSIGYKVLDSERADDGATVLKSLHLYEISMVNVPMNPLATIRAVKGASDGDTPGGGDGGDVPALPVGLAFADHADAVRDAVAGYIARVKAIGDLRSKEGRVFSGTNVGRMQTMADSLAEHSATLRDMCAMAAPKSAAPPPHAEEARCELIQFLRWQARSLGVSV